MVIYKNSMLQIVIYKKLNFWEEYTPLYGQPDSKISVFCDAFPKHANRFSNFTVNIYARSTFIVLIRNCAWCVGFGKKRS